MDADFRPLAERRLSTRHPPPRWLSDARVRSGYDARVINLSTNGALMETPCRLLPGGFVELRYARATDHPVVVRARVMRSAVSIVTASAIAYRGGLRFTSPLRQTAHTDLFAARPSSTPGVTLHEST